MNLDAPAARRRVQAVPAVLGLALAFLLAPAASPEVIAAQHLKPDLDRYCKERWPQTRALYSKRYRKWVCQKGRYEQSAYAVVLNEACATQFGAGAVSYIAGSDPRSREPIVRCHGGQAADQPQARPGDAAGSGKTPAPAARRSVRVDLSQYCRSRHGPRFFVSQRLTDGHPLCTKQNPSGGSQVHIAVDLAKACPPGTTFDRVEVDTMLCSSAAVAGGQAPPGGKAPSGGKTPSSGSGTSPGRTAAARPDAPPGAAAPSRDQGTDPAGSLRLPNKLKGCLVSNLDLPGTQKMTPDLVDRWSYRKPSPCPNLKGGKLIDLNAFCAGYVDGRITNQWTYNSATGSPITIKWSLRWRGDAPYCRTVNSFLDTNYSGRMQTQESESLLNGGVWYTCIAAWLRSKGNPGAGAQMNNSGQEFRVVLMYNAKHPSLRGRPDIAIRYQNRKLTCFYFPQGTLAKKSPGGPQVFFTEPDPPYKRIDDLVPGERFRIAVVFDRAQRRSTETVTLTTEGGRDAKRFVTRRTRDRKVFRSGPIRLTDKRVQP